MLNNVLFSNWEGPLLYALLYSPVPLWALVVTGAFCGFVALLVGAKYPDHPVLKALRGWHLSIKK
jgi:hypothetical protein